jgi:glutathione S-transferase
MITLYNYTPSGNCYKVRLLLAHLGIPFAPVEIDLTRGEGRTPEFRAKFPLGRVPVVVLDDGTQLAESNAILWYFAEGTRYVPPDSLGRAEVLQWMFWEQYSHEPFVAVARAWLKYFGVPAGKEAELRERQARGEQALDVLERRLTDHPFLAAEAYTIADIALFAYTHVAGEGGFDLAPRPAIRAWISRVRDQPGHVPIV